MVTVSGVARMAHVSRVARMIHVFVTLVAAVVHDLSCGVSRMIHVFVTLVVAFVRVLRCVLVVRHRIRAFLSRSAYTHGGYKSIVF